MRAHLRPRLIAAMLGLLPPEALARLLGLLEVGQGRAPVVAEREVGLRDEAGRCQREGQRPARELPAVERPWICEPGLLVIAPDLEDREASVGLPDEVVVRDDQPAPALPDVLVQQLVRVACGHALRRDRVDEEAARARFLLAHVS